MQPSFSGALREQGWYLRLRYRARSLLWTLRRNYEEPEYYLLPHLVDPTRCAVDVGGNYGAYAGKLAQLTARVHCFEPDTTLAQQLRMRLPESVVVHQRAVSDRAGTAEFIVPHRADGTRATEIATIEPRNPVTTSDRALTTSVEVVRLDDVVREPVGFIKVDVEGHERAVLDGAGGILRAHRPVLLVESARLNNPAAPFDVFQITESHGYVGLFLQRGVLTPLAAFREELHHRLKPDGTPDRAYVFNFIFLPR